MPITLSIAIITLNEERIIEKAIDAISTPCYGLPFANEIVVIDSGSTDKTLEILKKQNIKIFHQDWLGYSDQKNLAISKCSGDWILSLDADEIITDILKNEILEAINNPKDNVGFKIARNFYIGKRLIKHGGYYPDYQLRLFKRDTNAQFQKREVHESIKLDGKVGYLKNPLEHFAYEDLDHYKKSLEKYAELAAKEVKKKNLPPKLRSTWAFIYRYIFRFGFLDKSLGLELAKAYSNYVYRKYYLA
jgi:glycosyltransferase involved in cell wall biosynthesis